MVLSGHPLPNGGLHQPRQGREDVDGGVDLRGAETGSGRSRARTFPSFPPILVFPPSVVLLRLVLIHPTERWAGHTPPPLSPTNPGAWVSVQFSSVAQACPTLCDLMNRSTPGLPVHHQLLEFTQTHVHRVGDAIQASHPLSSPSPPAPNPSQHQSLFQ